MPSESYAYAVRRLTRNPKASYADVLAGAARQELPMPTIVYGRAKKHLGLQRKAAPKRKAVRR